MRDTLAGRMAIILLTTFVLLQLMAAIVLLWPASLMSVAPALPSQAVSVVEAMDSAPESARPAIAHALQMASMAVQLHQSPPAAADLRLVRDASVLARYRKALGPRVFRLEVRTSSWWTVLRQRDHRSVIRLTARLRDGAYVSVEKSSRTPLRGLTGQGALLGALVGLTVIGSLLVAFRETARPVAHLARATRAFMVDGQTGDLEERGPREVRDLANALNTLRKRVQDLVQDRTRILAAIAHDMRTYLTRIRLRVELLENDQERAQAISDLSEMSALLDDTLLYARAGAEGEERSVEALDVRAELAAFCAIQDAMGLPVSWTDHPGAVVVMANRLAVRRILNNLVDNALRFGRAARLSLRIGPDHAEIWVEDDGPGISEDQRQAVQDPFVRLEPSRGRHAGGAGLGLAIVSALAAAQGGLFSLAEAENGGLRAVVSLRLAAPAGL